MFPALVSGDTADGKNPANHLLPETLWKMQYSPYQLLQDFFHQQYFCVYLRIFFVQTYLVGGFNDFCHLCLARLGGSWSNCDLHIFCVPNLKCVFLHVFTDFTLVNHHVSPPFWRICFAFSKHQTSKSKKGGRQKKTMLLMVACVSDPF